MWYSSLPSLPVASGCWQKERPVKPVRAHAKVGSQLESNWPSMSLESALIQSMCAFSITPQYFYTSCCGGFQSSPVWRYFFYWPWHFLSLPFSLPLLCSPPTVWIFDECLTFSYHALFLCSSQGSLMLSLPLTPPGLGPDTDTVLDTAVSHPSSLFYLYVHCAASLSNWNDIWYRVCLFVIRYGHLKLM